MPRGVPACAECPVEDSGCVPKLRVPLNGFIGGYTGVIEREWTKWNF